MALPRRAPTSPCLRHHARRPLARFIQAFAKIGLVPDSGGTWSLPRLIGEARAKALTLTAEPLGAETAAGWGLIWRAVDDDKLMEEATALATRLAAARPAASA